MSDYHEIQVVGMHFRGSEAKELAATLNPGDELFLEREDNNKYDQNAIKVMAADKNGEPTFHLGYINRDSAAWISPDLDSGARFIATVEDVRYANNNHYPYITLTKSEPVTIPLTVD